MYSFMMVKIFAEFSFWAKNSSFNTVFISLNYFTQTEMLSYLSCKSVFSYFQRVNETWKDFWKASILLLNSVADYSAL